ncbi:ubiquitinyl hydrolase 1 [Balamuthia mandrillaris]
MSTRLYHEKQVAGLCAVHALNTLLQGNIFTEIDLMQIANEFDRNERALMMEMGTESTDFLKYMAEDSGNVADDGNYSVQVIQKALEVWNLKCVPLASPEMVASRQNPLIEQAFICNLASHWLTIRNVEGDWYNFNSLLNEPQYLSDFYLSAFLDTLMAKGYSIFCVKGELPKPQTNILGDSSNWITVKRKKTASDTNYDEELEAAIAASLSEAASSSSSSTTATQVIEIEDEDEDDELKAALALSLSTPPPSLEPPLDTPVEQVTTLVVRLPDGTRSQRRFFNTDLLQAVYHWLEANHNISPDRYVLFVTHPQKQILNEGQSSLLSLGLSPSASLFLQDRFAS